MTGNERRFIRVGNRLSEAKFELCVRHVAPSEVILPGVRHNTVCGENPAGEVIYYTRTVGCVFHLSGYGERLKTVTPASPRPPNWVDLSGSIFPQYYVREMHPLEEAAD